MTPFAKETLPVSLEEEMRRSYLDYAMSVIVGRALPDARDGLKPVHRRCLFAMHEQSNHWNRPYKKSARIVGDVMGKYHPHGDSAIYETIVRMAQPFSLRHMLVDGQGNFGSVDGDNAAAMRYTEIRLSKIAAEMLADIDKETVDFAPNYDGSEHEPTVLPARLPNLLVNGSSGIAVGMATNIPPHNLNEVVDGCLHLLKNPGASIDELMEIIPAPDFPTAGIIYGLNGVREGYRTGRGKVVMRAKCHFEDIGKGERQAIIVDEIPYQVNKKTLLERMAELVHEKKIEGISHIQDESDKSGMRVVIELKRGEVPEVVLNNLYKQTQLQRRPAQAVQPEGPDRGLPGAPPRGHHTPHGLRAEEGARTRPRAGRPGRGAGQHRRVHRDHQDQPHAAGGEGGVDGQELGQQHGARDAGARRGKHHRRPRRLPAGRPARQLRPAGRWPLPPQRRPGAGDPADAPAKAHRPGAGQDHRRVPRGDDRDCRPAGHPGQAGTRDHHHQRRTRLGARRSVVVHNAQELGTEDLITPTDMVVTLSHTGYIKSQPLTEYRAQKRGGRGKQATQTKDDDWVDQLFIANTHDWILCFSDRGRVYWLKVWEVPQGSRNSRGKPIVNMFPLQAGEKVTVVLPLTGATRSFPADHFVFMSTVLGTVKKTSLDEFSNPRKAGIIAVDLDEGDHLIGAALTDGQHDVMLFSDGGKAVRFAEDEVRPLSRTARGVRGMALEEGQRVIAMLVAEDETQSVLTATENGYGKRTSIVEYTRHGRGTKGMIAIQQTERNGKVVAATLVRQPDEIMLITDKGVLVRTRVSEIRELGRATQGVTLIALDNGAKLSGLQRIVENDAPGADSADGEDNPTGEAGAEGN